ncbi:MAG: hypothetical protein L0Z62_44400 [Gemmataceae bacterium]|nr:hypothetical protein [Gemmataceae bacterium]
MRLLSLVCCALMVVPFGARAQQAPDLETVMTRRGKVLVSAAFDRPPGKGWLQKKGTWEIVDKAIRASERADDEHAAVMRYPLSFHNAVIQFSFKLDGANGGSLSINGASGHVCRVLIRPTGISVKKDRDKKTPGDKGAILGSCSVAIKPGVWHTLLVELHGTEMVACLDGKHFAIGKHNAIDVPKTNFGLTVSGQSMSFKNLHVWEAQPNPGWEATRARLLARTATR